MEDPRSQINRHSVPNTSPGAVDRFIETTHRSHVPSNSETFESGLQLYSTSPVSAGQSKPNAHSGLDPKLTMSRDDQLTPAFPTTLSQLRDQLLGEGETTGSGGKFLIEQIERTLREDTAGQQATGFSIASLNDKIGTSSNFSYDPIEDFSYSLLYADSDPTIFQKLEEFSNSAMISEEIPKKPAAPPSPKDTMPQPRKRPPFRTTSSCGAIFSRTSSSTTVYTQPSTRRGYGISPLLTRSTSNVSTTKKSSPALTATSSSMVDMEGKKGKIEQVRPYAQTSREHQAYKR